MVLTNSNICYVTDEFKYSEGDEPLISSMANTCEDNRVLWCTTLAAVSRGLQYSNNPNVRYKALLKEAAPFVAGGNGTPSRPLEFVPVVLNCVWRHDIGKVGIKLNKDLVTYLNLEDFINRICKFGFIENNPNIDNTFIVRTNMRAVINAGIEYNMIPYNTEEELATFKAVRVRAPMFVFNHLVTHTMLSKEARSERVVDFINPRVPNEYPEPFNSVFWKPEAVTDDMFNRYLTQYSFTQTIEELKELGLKKEIYQRAILEWRYKDFVMVGWYNDITWGHLFKERGADADYSNWTQEETKETVKTIKEVILS